MCHSRHKKFLLGASLCHPNLLIVQRIVFCFVIAMLLLYVYRLFAYLEVRNNLCGYKVVYSMNISRFYFLQRRCLICQWNACCDEWWRISINHSINLIIDYFNNRIIDVNWLIVAALALSLLQKIWEPVCKIPQLAAENLSEFWDSPWPPI